MKANSKQTEDDRRKWRRFNNHFPINYTIESERHFPLTAGYVHNFSEGGLLFDTEFDLHPGSIINIYIDVSNNKFILKGNVLRSQNVHECSHNKIAIVFKHDVDHYIMKTVEESIKSKEYQFWKTMHIESLSGDKPPL